MDEDHQGKPEVQSGIGRRRSAARTDSSASYQTKRKEIAEAAVRVFNRLGFERASIAAVAEEMGVDRASLYYYVSSKEALFDEVVRTVVERNCAIAKQIETSDLSPRRKLRDLITTLMTSYGDHYPLFYIYIRENLGHVSDSRSAWSNDMREINRLTTQSMIAIIEQGYADKSLRNVGPSRIVANGIFGVIGWTHRWFRPDTSDVSAADIGRTYADMILSGLEDPYR
ncbi:MULTISPECIES: TetR/AcrR family transcriptional regulator [Sphingomonas]|jgi:AcrR family transcriptional regulator|uniref:TetR/AcrR family transcriptional regulator n=1 Tax=Sphingomonas TaxID=13687 RepID=UPI0006FD8BB5|nr:TetR/AcrR family transcriptional regulator [Sphingomonas sp. Leaf20]KQM69168.1 TetR family transcriptional regulator [Sphingomonas sp. Leaf20]